MLEVVTRLVIRKQVRRRRRLSARKARQAHDMSVPWFMKLCNLLLFIMLVG